MASTLESQFWDLVKSHLPKKAHSQRIETGGTGRGIPDVNICYNEIEVWIELKIVKGKKVDLSAEQVAWLFRRARAGGRCWIVARDQADGPRKGKYDRIYAWSGDRAGDVLDYGIEAEGALVWDRPWSWDHIIKELLFAEEL